MADQNEHWETGIRSDARWVSRTGYAVIFGLVGAFGYWAATAPIARAAIAPGNIAAAGRNILIQHLEGGVVQRILVQEGDAVKAGQDLYVLDPTAARTNVNRLRKQIVSLKASLLRLSAERDGVAELVMPDSGAFGDDLGDVRELIDEQHKEFVARLARFQSEQEILRQRVATLNETAVGLRSQDKAIARQIEIVQEELIRKKKLVDLGLTNLFEYTQIQRNESDLIGQAASIESQLAANATQVLEAREQIERTKTQRVEEAVAKLNEVRISLADTEEQLLAARAVLSRTTIQAPADGIVVSMIYNSIGSVVAPGEKVIEIVPTSNKPIVEARLSLHEIDAVHIGQPARLRLVALNSRLTPEVAGIVTYVSADKQADQATQEVYYRARLQITDQLPLEVDASQFYPGMPVEAYIDGGERTFAEYLVRPILDSFSRAFSEE
jgi:HlyD family type I secretion membrane fusion protein